MYIFVIHLQGCFQYSYLNLHIYYLIIQHSCLIIMNICLGLFIFIPPPDTLFVILALITIEGYIIKSLFDNFVYPPQYKQQVIKNTYWDIYKLAYGFTKIKMTLLKAFSLTILLCIVGEVFYTSFHFDMYLCIIKCIAYV